MPFKKNELIWPKKTRRNTLKHFKPETLEGNGWELATFDAAKWQGWESKWWQKITQGRWPNPTIEGRRMGAVSQRSLAVLCNRKKNLKSHSRVTTQLTSIKHLIVNDQSYNHTSWRLTPHSSWYCRDLSVQELYHHSHAEKETPLLRTPDVKQSTLCQVLKMDENSWGLKAASLLGGQGQAELLNFKG